MEFIESFMLFSFDDDNVFRIEDDELVKAEQGRKACECVVLMSDNVAFIEAKASAPNNANKGRFDTFISDIRDKFENSLQLFESIRAKKYGEKAYERLPKNLRMSCVDNGQYKICLIIHGHKLDWLIGLLDALRYSLREVVQKWEMRDSNIKVYNEQTALENHLIENFIPDEELAFVREPNGNGDTAKMMVWFKNNSRK